MIKSDDHDGQDFDAAVYGLFGKNYELKKRERLERVASRTPKQKARKKIARTAQLNLRTTQDNAALARALAKHLNISMAKMVDLAVAELAAREKLELDK